MPRPVRPPLLAVLLLLAADAAACRRASGPPPERYLSAEAEVAVVVPELRRALRDVAALRETAASVPGTPAAALQVGPLAAQLGFDPFDADALAQAGLEPSRGAAFGTEPAPDPDGAPAPITVLPVRDAGALEATVARIARERLGAPARTEATSGEVRVVTFRANEGGPPALALGFRDRTAALAAGPRAPEVVRAGLTLPSERSLAGSPAWRELHKALGERYAVLVAGSHGLPAGLRQRVALGASAEAAAIRLGVAVRAADQAPAWKALQASGDAGEVLRALSPEAALVLRWDGDPAALGRLVLPRVPEQDRRWLAARGFDLQRDLFDVLGPGVAAAVSLSPRFDLSDLSPEALRADPLRVVSFELAGDVKEEAAAARALARLPALFEAMGAPPARPNAADPAGPGGRVATASGEIAWRLEGKRLWMAGGAPRAVDALRTRKAGYAPPSEGAAAALDGGLGGGVLAPRRLAASVRGLPDEAFGTGPFGFVVRGVVHRYLELLDRVRAVSVRAELRDAALVIDARVEIPPREGAP